MSARPVRQGLWQVFRVPAILAALSLTGLVGALLRDGLWDGIGTVLLASSLVVAAWAIRSRS